MATSCFATRTPHSRVRDTMSEDTLGFASTPVGGRESGAALEPLASTQEPPAYSMQASSGKEEGGSNLSSFHNNPPPAAYAPPPSSIPAKRDINEVNAHASPMDPNLSGPRRSEGAQPGYPNMRQDQQTYRLDLLQTEPGIDSNSALHSETGEQDSVTRAFPFFSNSMTSQDGDSRASIFPPNFSNVGAGAAQDATAAASANNLGYKKPESNGQDGGTQDLHAKNTRDASYDALSPPEKKETPYSRSPSLRVTHKIAERKRRKEMKDLFDELKDYVPVDRGPKTSKGDILTKAVLQFQTLHREREQLIEALEAAHHELNQLRQVTGNADHAGTSTAPGLPHHVYPHSSAAAAAAPYLSRAQPSRLPGGLVHGAQDHHLSLGRSDKGEGAPHAAASGGAPGVNMAPNAPRSGEPFLSDLRLDRLRQTDDAVHPNFKQLEHGTGVLDQSLGGARPFQPEPYQAGLVSSELPSNQDAASMSADTQNSHAAGRPVSAPRYMPRSDGADLMQESTPGEPSNM